MVDGADSGRVVQFEAAFDMVSAEPKQTVRLFGPDVAVQEFSASGGSTGAQLVREGQNVSVSLPKERRGDTPREIPRET